MMLKGLQVASSQATRPAAGVAARLNAVASVSRRRPAAFKAGRQSLRVAATAEPEAQQPARAAREVTVNLADVAAGDQFEGVVTAVEGYGAFVNFGAEKDGLVHISQLSDGYVSNAAAVAKVGQSVVVRVLSVDAATGKIALTMKGAAVEADEFADGAEGEDEAAGETEEYDDEEEATRLVYADEAADFGFPFVVEAEEGELTEVVATVAAGDFEVEHETDLDLPLNELVSGQVTRVDAYGAYISVTHNGKEVECYLDREEAKVPASALSAEELRDFVGEGEAVPEYIDIVGQDILYEDDEDEDACEEVDDRYMFEDMTAYYKVGEEVKAFVLGYDIKRDVMALTHFTDAEVQSGGLDVLTEQILEEEADDEEGEGERRFRRGPRPGAEEEEDAEDDVPLSRLGDATDFDPLAFSPEELMEMGGAEEEAAGAEDDELVADMEGEAAEAVGEYKVLSRGTLGLKSGTISLNDVSLPDRSADGVDVFALNHVKLHETDFDGDVNELEDMWQDSGLEVSKGTWKAMNLKFQWGESGEAELVPREGAEEQEDSIMDSDAELLGAVVASNADARAASWVSLLLDEEEGEAEVPALAMRRPVVLAASVEASAISATVVKALRDKTGAGMMDCKKALGACGGDAEKAMEWLRQKGLSGADKKAGRVAAEGAVSMYIHPGSRLGVLLEVNCETDFVAASDKFRSLVGELGMIVAASPDVLVVSPDEVPAEVLAKEREVEMGKEDIKSKPEAVRAKIVEGRLEKMRNTVALVNQASLRDPTKTVAEIVKETIAAVGENVQIRRFVKFNLGEGMVKKSNDFAAEVAQQTQAKKKEEAPKKEEKKEEEKKEVKPTFQAPAGLVKELRDKTGAGMMDCKKALGETNGDVESAVEWLRKKGLSGADKKAGRVAAEGVVAAYIHPGSRLGVLLEVNCETDFVARSDPFNKLVNGLAMQIAASPQVQYVAAEDIPAEVFEREKQIEMGREDLQSKPEAIRAKIAEGRVAKLAQEMALLPQAYLMDNSKTVEQAVKEAIAAIGEKISIRRFVRFQLGEGIEKKVNDLAADVAAMTAKSA